MKVASALLSGAVVLSVCALARPAEAQSRSYAVAPVTGEGTLTGRVTFAGAAPRPSRLLITKDIEVCGTGYRIRQDVVVADDGGLAGVVVFLEGITSGKEWTTPAEGYAVDQRDCYFAPHIQVIPRGATLAVLNSDPVLHNIHAYEILDHARRSLFNLGQPPEKQRIDQAIRTRRGHLVGLECDAHDFMVGWLFAATNPYYAVTGPDGTFAIDDIPPGTYTVKALHPTLRLRETEVTIEADQRVRVTFEFAAGG